MITPDTLKELLPPVTKIAHEAGLEIMKIYQSGEFSIQSKSDDSPLTAADLASHYCIIDGLEKLQPSLPILSEESDKISFEARSQWKSYWLIDPLDGTTNFLHGFPVYAVSIALQHKNKLQLAVVYDPLRDELFTAEKGGGAMLNNRKIRVTQPNSLKGALIGTGFPFKSKKNLDAYLGMFSALIGDTAGIRRAGAAALDLAYVAAGRLDGFWEIGLQPWDMAAGILLIQEAGGVLTDFSFKDQYFQSGNVIAGSPKMHQLMYKAIEPHLTDNLR